MCKSQESRKKAVDSFFAKLEGENYEQCRAIVDFRDEVPNLVGFFAIVDETTANFFNVVGDVARVCEFIPTYGRNWGNRAIAGRFARLRGYGCLKAFTINRALAL